MYNIYLRNVEHFLFSSKVQVPQNYRLVNVHSITSHHRGTVTGASQQFLLETSDKLRIIQQIQFKYTSYLL